MSIKRNKKELRDLIEELTKEAETDILEGTTMPPEDFEWLVNTVTELTLIRIDKFIAGAKEHGGSFLNNTRDDVKELREELIDADFFLAKLERSIHMYDKRY